MPRGLFFLLAIALHGSPARAAGGTDSAILEADTPIRVPGSGGFDFLKVDGGAHRLLAAHTGNGTLDVFSVEDGHLIKQVPVGMAQDVAVDPANGRYLVSASREQKLVFVDSSLLTVSGEIKLSGPADAIGLNPKNQQLYVGHDDGKELWVIDTIAKQLVTTIEIPEGPEMVVCDPISDRIFQNVKKADTTLVIDPVTHAITARWPTAPAKSPHGLAYNPETHHLFCAGGNGKLVALDATTGQLAGTADTGKGVDQIVFDPATKRIYCGCSTGIISVVEDSPAGLKTLGEVPSHPGAKTLACDPVSHAVWIAYSDKASCYIQRYQPK